MGITSIAGIVDWLENKNGAAHNLDAHQPSPWRVNANNHGADCPQHLIFGNMPPRPATIDWVGIASIELMRTALWSFVIKAINN